MLAKPTVMGRVRPAGFVGQGFAEGTTTGI
jgi:hypothetical protein